MIYDAYSLLRTGSYFIHRLIAAETLRTQQGARGRCQTRLPCWTLQNKSPKIVICIIVYNNNNNNNNNIIYYNSNMNMSISMEAYVRRNSNGNAICNLQFNM